MKVVRFSLVFILLVSLGQAYAQRYTISGFVTDKSSGEALVGATVFVLGKNYSATSNNFGFYSVNVPKSELEIVFSFVGYARDTVLLEINANVTLNIKLEPALEIEAVILMHNRIEKQLHSTQMSTLHLPMARVSKLPAMAGEVDLLKILQLYPGVSGGTEGSVGLNVRGGSPDQNLILLDGVPVYNISHLFGFVSVFNPDAISNVQLYKGAFPARFGGRLSSVVDITMREGNSSRFVTTGTIGPLASRIAFEGPLIKGKTSFIATARRSLVGFALQPLSISASKKAGDDENYNALNYYFYDANLKVNHRFSHKSRLFFGVYSGKDDLASKFYYKDSFSKSAKSDAID